MQDGTNFLDKGGFDNTDAAFEKGMVLALSMWDDHDVNMLWLDSTYPVDTPDAPGAKRGTCDTSSGDPKDVESAHADAITHANAFAITQWLPRWFLERLH